MRACVSVCVCAADLVLKMSEAVHNPEEYVYLTDDIFKQGSGGLPPPPPLFFSRPPSLLEFMEMA